MSVKKNNAAAEAVAALKSAFEAAEIALNAITETSSVEEKEAAQTAFDTSKAAYETAIAPKPPKAKEEKLEIEFILSPTGKFKLGYNVGEKAAFPTLQADELIDAGYAKLVK